MTSDKDLKSLSVKELKAELEKINLSQRGNKEDYVDRLRSFLSHQFSAQDIESAEKWLKS